MDILSRQKYEREQVLRSEKYQRVKERASQLLKKNIELRLISPSSITVFGNYNGKVWDRLEGIKIKIPYSSKDLDYLDLSEDSLVAFILSEYFYVYKEESFFNVDFVKSFFKADIYAAELTKNPYAMIEVLEIFQTVVGLNDSYIGTRRRRNMEPPERRNAFLQRRINSLIENFNIGSEMQLDVSFETAAAETRMEKADILPKYGSEPAEAKLPVRSMPKESSDSGFPVSHSKMPEDFVFTNSIISSKSLPPVFLCVILILAAAAAFILIYL